MNADVKFILENLFQMTAIPSTGLDHDSSSILYSIGYVEIQNPLQSDKSLIKRLADLATGRTKPALEFENGIFAYGVLAHEQSDLIILGPVLLGKATPVQISEYARLHMLPIDQFNLTGCSLTQLIAAIINVWYHLSGQKMSVNDLTIELNLLIDPISRSSVQNYQMSNAENEVMRVSYAFEKVYIQRVSEGDVESIIAMQNDPRMADFLMMEEKQMGLLAVNKLKHFEYMTCAAITLFSRAAIESGVDAASAYALSDLFLQRLEKCTSITQMMNLSYHAQLDYATQVKKIIEKRSRSSHVEKAKSYIANHLNKPFTLDDVADAAGISKPYLAVRFAEEEGVGVMVYVRNKRIEAAANMLKYSDECLSTIAAYLCFHSQSHFGARFKSIMGVTPHQYRELHRVIDVKK